MAATLDCTISGGDSTASPSTAFTYALQVENFQVSLRRSPIQVSVTNLNILQDFGATAPTVSVRGIIPTVSPGTDGTNIIANKDLLEDKIISLYAKDYTLQLGAGTGAATTTSYVGRVQNVSFALVPGKEQIYWTFNLTLVTKNRDVA
jgi:hypothetical protein|tara:strand:- start:175 stop:618 length:444 start_codon:yes stop_codon:yes gene_type:complete